MRRLLLRLVPHAVLLLAILIFALPIWIAVAGATQDSAAIARGEVSLLPNPHGFGVYRDVLLDGSAGAGPVWRALLVSAGMALAIALGKIALSLPSAYAVTFFRFPFRMTAFWLIFLTLMLPVEVRLIPTFQVMSSLDLINSFTGLTLPLVASAAARMDGAGPLRFLWDIVIPVSGANIAALFVILFVYGWNQYLWPLLVATDPKLDTVVIGIVKMIGVDTATEWNKVMATAVLALIPPVAVVLLMQRWFVKGLTEGDK